MYVSFGIYAEASKLVRGYRVGAFKVREIKLSDIWG